MSITWRDNARLCKNLASHHILGTTFSIQWWFLPETMFTEVFAKWGFSVFIILSIFINWNATEGQVSPLVERPGRHHHLWCLPNGDFLFLSFLQHILIGILLWRQIFPSVEKPGRSHINQMIQVNIISNAANRLVFLGVIHQEPDISSVKNTKLEFSYEEIADNSKWKDII